MLPDRRTAPRNNFIGNLKINKKYANDPDFPKSPAYSVYVSKDKNAGQADIWRWL